MSKTVNIQVNHKGKTVADGLYQVGKPTDGLKSKDEKEGLLRRLFRFGKRKSLDKNTEYIGLTKHSFKKQGKVDFKFTPESWDSKTKQLYEGWKRQTQISRERYESLMQLYIDMDEMFMNNAYMAKALKYRVAETLQQDLNMQPIGVEANKKQKKHILEFMERTGLQNLLPEIVEGRAKYGTHGLLLIPSETGIDELISVNAKDIQDILQFTAIDIENNLTQTIRGSYIDTERGDDFIEMILEKKDSLGAKFKKHLIGYQVGNELVPPWLFVPFRHSPNNSPWSPFGVPIFIHSLSAYRKYDFMESMEAMAFGLRFPIEKFKFTIPNEAEPTEAFYKVSEIMNQLNNSGLIIDSNFEQGLGRKVVTIEGLYNYEIQELKVDWGEGSNKESVLNELIASTFLPKGQIDPRDAQYAQQSGKALVQDFKPFARDIFIDQQSILESISTVIKIDMIQSGKFSLEEIDFTLTMPYPESQINDDIISAQKSQADLANTIIENLSEYMGIKDKKDVPIELVKDIFSQILPYDDKRIQNWLKVIDLERKKTEKEEETETMGGEEESPFGGGDEETESPFGGVGEETTGEPEATEEIEEEPVEETPVNEPPKLLTASYKRKHTKKLSEDVLKEVKKKVKENLKSYQVLLEGVDANRHYYNSKKSTDHFDLKTLIEIDRRILEKTSLKEGEYYE